MGLSGFMKFLLIIQAHLHLQNSIYLNFFIYKEILLIIQAHLHLQNSIYLNFYIYKEIICP